MAAKHPLHFIRGPVGSSPVYLGAESLTSGEDISWQVDKINAGEDLVVHSADPKLPFTISGPDPGSEGHKKTPNTTLSYTTGSFTQYVYYDVKAVNGSTETTLAYGYLVIATSGPPIEGCVKGMHHSWPKHQGPKEG